MLKVSLIGIGNCGNQIAALAKKQGGINVACINTSENDIATLPAEVQDDCYLVGDSQGSGKDRTEAKKFLKSSVMGLVADERFKAQVADSDAIFIVSSTGGGTGSGMAPLMASIIRQSFRNKDEEKSEKIVILVGVLPRLTEGLSTQVNTKGYMHELFDVLEDQKYMMYDNNKYAKESAPVIIQKINEEVVRDIKILQLAFNTPTPYDSIDEKDMKAILKTPGLIGMASAFNIKEKDLDEKTLEDLIIEQLKSNGHAELQRDGIVGNTGLIVSLSEKLNATFDTNIKAVRNFIGEPVEEFLHIAVNKDRDMPNNIMFIASGLSNPVDRLDKINERIDEINKKQEEQEKSKRTAVINEEEISVLNEKRKRPGSTAGEYADLTATFDKFGV